MANGIIYNTLESEYTRGYKDGFKEAFLAARELFEKPKSKCCKDGGTCTCKEKGPTILTE